MNITTLYIDDDFYLKITAPMHWFCELRGMTINTDINYKVIDFKTEYNLDIPEEFKNLPVFPNGDDVGWILNDMSTYYSEIARLARENNSNDYAELLLQLIPFGNIVTIKLQFSYHDLEEIYKLSQNTDDELWSYFSKQISKYFI